MQGADRREEKHFEDGGGPSHGKRHRQRASPHRYRIFQLSFVIKLDTNLKIKYNKILFFSACISRISRNKRERERDRGRERERERERERQATPPTASSSGLQGN